MTNDEKLQKGCVQPREKSGEKQEKDGEILRASEEKQKRFALVPVVTTLVITKKKYPGKKTTEKEKEIGPLH